MVLFVHAVLAMSIVQWLADSVLEDISKSQIASFLSSLGMEAWLVAALAPALAFLSVKAFWRTFEPPPKLDWSKLDPDNDDAMANAFNDLHTVATVAKYLNENDAPDLEAFRDQVRRLSLRRDQIRKQLAAS